jgi:hypothetical protein
LAALYEKDAEKYGEEDELLKKARCQKKLEKRRKISCVGGSKEGAFLILGPCYNMYFSLQVVLAEIT